MADHHRDPQRIQEPKPSRAAANAAQPQADEPMTGAQKSYLKALCEEAQQPFDEHLTKAQASMRIDELHRLTRRDAAPAVGRDVAVDGRSRA